MDAYHYSDTVHENLHGLYWGDLELETADLYQEGTVEMMKNTNNIRIVLQDVNSEQPVYGKDFTFSITDDNTLFGADNDLLGNGKVTYTPWARGGCFYRFEYRRIGGYRSLCGIVSVAVDDKKRTCVADKKCGYGRGCN